MRPWSIWNPGAIPKTRGLSVLAGLALIPLEGDFTRDTTFVQYDTDISTAVVPHVFATYRDDRLTYGLGVYVPYGLTSQWTEDFPGRFTAQKASLQTIYFQPNVAFQITEGWSVGLGPVIGHSSVELIQGIDLSQQRTSASATAPTFGQLGIAKGTEFARATLEGSATAYGVNVGFHGRITNEWQVGGRFLSQLYFKYDDAEAVFEQRPTGSDARREQSARRTRGNAGRRAARRPVHRLGGAHGPAGQDAHHAPCPGAGRCRIHRDSRTPPSASTTRGSDGSRSRSCRSTSRVAAPDRLLFEDYNNTSSIRVGVDHRFTNGAALRGGFAAAAAAAPDVTVTPLLPEQDRTYWTIGGGYPITSRFTVDGAFMKIFTPGRRGRLDERTARTQTAEQLNVGSYTLRANIFSLSLKASL